MNTKIIALCMVTCTCNLAAAIEIQLPDGTTAKILQLEGKTKSFVTAVAVNESGVTTIRQTSFYEEKALVKRADGTCAATSQEVTAEGDMTVANIAVRTPNVKHTFQTAECP